MHLKDKVTYTKLIYLNNLDFTVDKISVSYLQEIINSSNKVCLCINSSSIFFEEDVLEFLIINNIGVIFNLNNKVYKFSKVIDSQLLDYNKVRESVIKKQSVLVLKKRYNFLRRQYHKNLLTKDEVKEYKKFYTYCVSEIEKVNSVNSINGYIGLMQQKYYSLFSRFFHNDVNFESKKKESYINVCTDFLKELLLTQIKITLLANNVSEKIAIFRHSENNRSGALLQDLLFEVSPYFIDTVLLSVFNRKQLSDSDFKENNVLPDIAKEKLVKTFNTKLNSTFKHPILKEKTNYSDLISIQVSQIKLLLDGEIEEYEPIYLG